MAFLLLFPGLAAGLLTRPLPLPAPGRNEDEEAFIFLALNPLRSAVLAASPLLAWRFRPPKPNLSSFFWRLWFALPGRSSLPPPPPPPPPLLAFLSNLLVWALPSSCSMETSKRSASLVDVAPPDS